MKKYFSIFALSAVLCSQAFAGFEEVERDIYSNPLRASQTSLLLAQKYDDLAPRAKEPQFHRETADHYRTYAHYLELMSRNSAFNETDMHEKAEIIQSLEQILSAMGNRIPSATERAFAELPREKASASSAVAPRPTLSARDLEAQNALIQSGCVGIFNSFLSQFPNIGKLYTTWDRGTLSVKPELDRAIHRSIFSDKAYTSLEDNFYLYTYKNLFPQESYDLKIDIPWELSLRIDRYLQQIDMSRLSSRVRETMKDRSLPEILSALKEIFDRGFKEIRDQHPKAPTPPPASLPPLPKTTPAAAVPPIPQPLPLFAAPQQKVQPVFRAPAFREEQGAAAAVPPIPLVVAQERPAQVLTAGAEVVAKPTSVTWDKIDEAHRQVAFSIGATQSKLKSDLKKAPDNLVHPGEAQDVLDPQEFLGWIQERNVLLTHLLLTAPQELKDTAALHHIRKLDEFEAAFRTSMGQLGDIQPKVDALKAFLKRHGCGHDLDLDATERKKLDTQKEGLITNLVPLKDAYARLYGQATQLFPLDIAPLREALFPGLNLTEAKKPAAPPAERPPVKLISDDLDAGTKSVISDFIANIDRQVAIRAANQHQRDESIMNIGSGEIARDLFRQIDRVFPTLNKFFELPRVPQMTVDDLVQFHGAIVRRFPDVALKDLTSERIQASFRNLTQHFSDPFEHVDGRIPHVQYLNALAQFKVILEKYGAHPHMPVLIAEVSTGLFQQDLNCGAGAFGRSILVQNAIMQFLMKLEKPQ